MPDFTDTLKPAEPFGSTLLWQERAASNISIDSLSRHLFHDDFLERQFKILTILQREPLLQKTTQANLSRPERFKLALARAKLLLRLKAQHGWSQQEHEIAEYLVDDVSPYMLHMGMFITTIREQGNDEQRAYWLPKIEKWEIVGAYAQTELGHGSNVRGIELQARFDTDTKEFVLHSPTLTASKWWNGTLGRTANVAIVVAQLLLPDPDCGEGRRYKSYGPHPFIVQVRDMKTHEPFEGIVIGDIGPKYGYATMDNAYMLFNDFRIPHSALLSRYSTVNPDNGLYKKPTESALVYGTLTYMRSKIIQHARLVLARAVTIAVRYATVRRQFADRDSTQSPSPSSPRGPQELPVLDYPTVQIRILPLLASSFALHYTAHAMASIYASARADIERGDFSSLAYMHSMSSGLKSLCTTLAADGIETCRRALGGHGYGGGSGLVQLNADYLSKPTVEGDNWMITQQTAGFLVKRVGVALKGEGQGRRDEVDGQFETYLPLVKDGGKGSSYDILRNDEHLVRSFQHRATALAYTVYQARIISKKPWTNLMTQFHKLSKAQSQSILATEFHKALSANNNLPSPTMDVMWDLFRLFALFTLDGDRYEFFTCSAASQSQLDNVPEKINELMARIRPHAVRLVDSWMIPDYLLDSALGHSDGRVYEDLFNRAHRLNPLNEITVNPNYWDDEIVKGGESLKSIQSKL